MEEKWIKVTEPIKFRKYSTLSWKKERLEEAKTRDKIDIPNKRMSKEVIVLGN